MAEKSENTLEETEDQKSKNLSQNIFIYGIVIISSFFFTLLFLWYFTTMRNDNVVKKDQTAIGTVVDSTSVDSTKEAHKEVVLDSIPEDNLISTEDKIKILELENTQRQREIDHLWTMLKEIPIEQKKMKEELEDLQQAALLDTTPVPPKIIKQKAAKEDSAQQQVIQDAAISSNAKIYSSMKPAKAAVILAGFEPAIAAKILLKMRQRSSAKILEAMKPVQAAKVCQVMIFGNKNNKKKS